MIVLPTLDPSSLPALLAALGRLGLACQVVEQPESISHPKGILLASALPFEQNCVWLRRTGWWRELPHLVSEGIPLLALDAALHVLAEGSEEAPRESGLGLLPGCVRRMGPGIKLPHLGWSQVRQSRALDNIPDPADAWLHFQHAHALDPDASTLWEGRHGRAFTVLTLRGRAMGCQARLPQSGATGRLMLLRLLRAQGMAPLDR